jgi:phospholipid/cholesterol/gamma-HCH transport system permease protein
MLNIFFSVFGLAGSFAVAQIFNPMPASVYFGNILLNLRLPDIIVSVIKSITFGVIISIVAMAKGLAVERSSTEVPIAGLKAVSASFGWCILVDILLSALYYIMV